MLVRDASGRYESIDFRETAPAAAYEDMYKNYVVGSIRGGLAAGVPGEIRGFEYLHNKYGVGGFLDENQAAADEANRFSHGKQFSNLLLMLLEMDFLV